jgi:hypothetical protein
MVIDAGLEAFGSHIARYYCRKSVAIKTESQ